MRCDVFPFTFRARPRLLALEARLTPTGNLSRFAVGADAGAAPAVVVYNADGSQQSQFYAYDINFRGGVRVAMGDVNKDGVPDIATAAGPGGGPHVQVFDGATGNRISSWYAYSPSFPGGVTVAVGDVNGDGVMDVVTGAGQGGGPHVRVFNALTGTLEGEFFAYTASFTGGVWVATGNVSGGVGDNIITGAGPGGGPHVRVFSGFNGLLYDEFFAYDPSFRGGVTVAAADVTGDNHADVITGPLQQGGANVRVFGSRGLVLQNFLAFDTNFFGGIRVATADVTGEGRADILVGNGPGMSSKVRAFVGFGSNPLIREYPVFDPSFTGGIFVG